MSFNSKDFNGIYSDMYDYLGEETVRKINKYYKGQQITFPMRLYSKEYILNYILREYGKKSSKELARELGYSERWIKKLMDRKKVY